MISITVKHLNKIISENFSRRWSAFRAGGEHSGDEGLGKRGGRN